MPLRLFSTTDRAKKTVTHDRSCYLLLVSGTERDPPHIRARRRQGERSREAILGEAARLATLEGLDGLSIGGLAQRAGISKSGVFSHFGSKEELQLATIDAATEIFERRVLAPAAVATSGLERLRLLADAYLRYVEDDVFPGGCFFASVLSEMDTHAGAVRDRLVDFLATWLGHLEAAIRAGQAQGALDPDADPADLTFEIEAALFLANTQYVVARTSEPIERARRVIMRRIDAAAAGAKGPGPASGGDRSPS
jgi:AcrR family transcriptional regulator